MLKHLNLYNDKKNIINIKFILVLAILFRWFTMYNKPHSLIQVLPF